MRILMLAGTLLFLITTPPHASADFFMCMGKDGQAMFQDTPCKKHQRQKKLDLEDGVLGQCRGNKFSGVFVSAHYPQDGAYVEIIDTDGKTLSLFFPESSEIEVDEGYYEGYMNHERVVINGDSQMEMVLTCITRHELDIEEYMTSAMADHL